MSSPDEATLAVTAVDIDAKTADIWLTDRDGRNRRSLTRDRHSAGAVYVPDGSKIIFGRVEDLGRRQADLFVVGADGSDPVQLTRDGDVVSAAVSPDGKKIVYERAQYSRGTDTFDIYIMNVDGGEAKKVTSSSFKRSSSISWAQA